MNYKIIDLLVQVSFGIGVAYAVTSFLPRDWNMFSGMIAGGAFGMAIMFLIMIPIMAVFGSF